MNFSKDVLFKNLILSTEYFELFSNRVLDQKTLF